MPTPKGWTWPASMRARWQERAGTPQERFNRCVEFEPNSGCWLWSGTLLKGTGYGQIQIDGRAISAHRLSYQLHRGPIPRDLSVLHKCDVRACVNPDHLFLGTHRDNMADMARKGRTNPLIGDDHARGKITSQDIPRILARLLIGHSCAAIAADYGVTDCAINAIRRGKSWTHVTGLPKARATKFHDHSQGAPGANNSRGGAGL